MKKIICCTYILILSFLLWGCAVTEKHIENNDKITVIATLFSPYDFTKAIGGDRVSVTKLIPAGTESHTYEPTPSDIIAINNSDLFIYTGEVMEPWVDKLLNSVEGTPVCDTSFGVDLLAEDDDHGDLDGHIWTDPTQAMKMADNIAASLSEIDPDYSDYYHENARKYKEELAKVDMRIMSIVDEAKIKEIIVADSFSLQYFCVRYGLDYMAALDSCSGESEPSARQVVNIVNELENKDIGVVFYGELTKSSIAENIADEIHGKALVFHSCHNVTKSDMDNGVTYLELMNRNADYLKEALN